MDEWGFIARDWGTVGQKLRGNIWGKEESDLINLTGFLLKTG